jgi:hypothetical protein
MTANFSVERMAAGDAGLRLTVIPSLGVRRA